MADEETYADWTVEELRSEASTRDIEGRSAMNKDELVAALEADDEADEDVGVTEIEVEDAPEGPNVDPSSADAQRFFDPDGKPKEEPKAEVEAPRDEQSDEEKTEAREAAKTKAMNELTKELAKAEAAVEEDDRSDPERFAELKAKRESVRDALRDAEFQP